MSNVVEAPDSIQPATLSFSDLYQKAMAHPAGNDDLPNPAQDPVVSAIEAPAAVASPAVAEAPAAPAPPLVANPAEVKVLDLPDDAQIRVKIDGSEKLVSVKDYKDGISREAVFTQRMQQLAEQRRDAEAQLAAQYAEIQRQAQAVELAKQELGSQFGTLRSQLSGTPGAPQATAKSLDPTDLATVGDVQSTIEAQLAQIRAEQKAQQEGFVKALGEAGQQMQQRAVVERDAVAYTSHLNTVMSNPEFAILKKINPFAEEIVRHKVAEMEPKTIQEAMSFTDTYVKGWYSEVATTMAESAKRHEVAKAQARIEPPAGSPAPPAAQFKPGSAFTKDGKFDWNALRARAESML